MFHVKQAPSLPSVSCETEEALSLYVTLLQRWSPRINLVSPSDLPHVRQRHVLDSLQLLPLVPDGTERGIDLGSGAGFPGLILSIAGSLPFDLIESDQRKAAFLREAIRETGAPARVHATRIETAALPAASLVTARALAPLRQLLDLAVPHLRRGGTCLFPKGARVDVELTDAEREWHMHAECFASRTSPDAGILRLRDPQRRPHR